MDGDDQNEQERDVKRDRERERTYQEPNGAADGRPESSGFRASLVGVNCFDGFGLQARTRTRGADRIRSRDCGKLALA